MLKLKMIVNVLLLLTISIYLHPVDKSIAGTCDEMESSESTPTFTGNHNYYENWSTSPELDPGIPEEIAPNNSITLSVSGGCSPYTWSVSGQGFTLDESITTGLTNTLNSNGTSCGSAEITVTDCVGNTTTKYIRGTEGQWVQIATCGVSVGHEGCSITVGKYRYDQEWCALCPSDPRSCEEACEHSDCGGVFCNAAHYLCSGSETWCWARYKATFEWGCN
jgi:hypothetical protein